MRKGFKPLAAGIVATLTMSVGLVMGTQTAQAAPAQASTTSISANVTTAAQTAANLPQSIKRGIDVGVGDGGGENNPPVDGGGTKPPGGGGGGGGGGGTTPPGNGGGSTLPPNPEVRYFTRTYDYRNGGAPQEALAQCAQSETRIGATVRYSQRYTPAGDAILGSIRVISANCIDMTISYTSATCVTGADAYIDQVAPVSRRIVSNAVSTPFGAGNHTQQACGNAVSITLSADPTALGRYQALAKTYRVAVRFKHAYDPFSGGTTTTLDSMGAPYVSNTNSARLQITCYGVSSAWTESDFSFTPCGPQNPSTQRYQCVPSNGNPAVTISGQPATSATLFRSGDETELKWNPLRPSSELSINSATTRFVRDSNGTPWRENGASLSKANFTLTTLKGNKANQFVNENATNWMPNAVGDTYVRGYWASEEGRPNKITPTWNYTGTMQIQVPTGITYDGNAWHWSTRTETIENTAACVGPTVDLTYVRAVTSQ